MFYISRIPSFLVQHRKTLTCTDRKLSRIPYGQAFLFKEKFLQPLSLPPGFSRNAPAAARRRKKLERRVPKVGAKSGPTFGPPRSLSHLNSSSRAPPGGSKNGPTFGSRGFVFFATWVSFFWPPWFPKKGLQNRPFPEPGLAPCMDEPAPANG